jgi:hypothetical protein
MSVLIHSVLCTAERAEAEAKRLAASKAEASDAKYASPKSPHAKKRDEKSESKALAAASAAAAAEADAHSSFEPGSDAANLLVSQIKSVTACALRAMYALFTTGSFASRRDALKVLRAPATLLSLNEVLASYNYGIRRSVFDEPSPDRYHTASKLLCVLEEVLDYSEAGIAQGVNALEVAEVVCHVRSPHFIPLTACSLLLAALRMALG